MLVKGGRTLTDENRVQGPLRNATGKMQEELGRPTGDFGTRVQGQLNQVAGTAQDMYGQARDAARDAGTTLDQWFRRALETQPYTTALVILGVGGSLAGCAGRCN